MTPSCTGNQRDVHGGSRALCPGDGRRVSLGVAAASATEVRAAVVAEHDDFTVEDHLLSVYVMGKAFLVRESGESASLRFRVLREKRSLSLYAKARIPSHFTSKV